MKVDDIAAMFVRYYWRQAAPHPTGKVLLQNNGKQATLVTKLIARRRTHTSLTALRRDGVAWGEVLRAAAKTIRDQPLTRLQSFQREEDDFLYRIGEGSQDVELRPGVAYCMRKFHGLIHELVRSSWTRFVRRVDDNARQLDESVDLGDFLFGNDRDNLSPYVDVLAEFQDGRCFYCGGALGARPHVDHFVPWSLYPVDFGHNFVLADATCNASKGDSMSALRHLDAWVRRNRDCGLEMAKLFTSHGLSADLATSVKITKWAYQRAFAAGDRLWDGPRLYAGFPPEWDATSFLG